MTPDQRFTLLLSGIGLLFLVMSAILGILWKAATNYGRMNANMQDLVGDVNQIGQALDTHIRWHMDKTDDRGRR